MASNPTSSATADVPPKDPHLPPLHRVGKLIAPKPPQEMAATGLEGHILADLMLKWGFTETRFATDWAAEKLHLSPALTRQVLERVCLDGTMEQLWQTGSGGHHYRITAEGRAARGAVARDLRLHRPGAGQPGRLCGVAALAIRPHSAGACGARGRRPLGTGLVTESRAARRPRRLFRAQPVSLWAPGKRQEQHRPEHPCRSSRRLLDPLRHQRGQRRDPLVRSAGPSARRERRRAGRGDRSTVGSNPSAPGRRRW